MTKINRMSGAVLLLIAMLLPAALAGAQTQSSSPPTNNKELEGLYKADQADREGSEVPSPDEMGAMLMRDERRRTRVLEIVEKETLNTADDYFHAAVVLQHGGEPQHFLMAHELANVAAFRGHAQGPWLSASALDRFLQSIGRPQRFGTQFRKDADAPWTQEPYDRSMIDAIRKAYGVHTLAEQSKKLEELNKKK